MCRQKHPWLLGITQAEDTCKGQQLQIKRKKEHQALREGHTLLTISMPDHSRYLPAVCWCLWATVLLKAPVCVTVRAMSPGWNSTTCALPICFNHVSEYTGRAVKHLTYTIQCVTVCLPAKMAFPGWVSFAFPAGAAADRPWGLRKGLTNFGSPDMVQYFTARGFSLT